MSGARSGGGRSGGGGLAAAAAAAAGRSGRDFCSRAARRQRWRSAPASTANEVLPCSISVNCSTICCRRFGSGHAAMPFSISSRTTTWAPRSRGSAFTASSVWRGSADAAALAAPDSCARPPRERPRPWRLMVNKRVSAAADALSLYSARRGVGHTASRLRSRAALDHPGVPRRRRSGRGRLGRSTARCGGTWDTTGAHSLGRFGGASLRNHFSMKRNARCTSTDL